MMKRLSFIVHMLVMLIVICSAEAQQLSDSYIDVIVNLDREMAGLLDAYLEAVPECPITSETPVRLWLLDVAWLRAAAALDSAETLDIHSISSHDLAEAWTSYLNASQQYLNVFRTIQIAYREVIPPDSEVCIELENQLLEYDSLWSLKEAVFFELFAEEEAK